MPAQKRLSADVPKSKVWDSAHGKFTEEELPADIQELMGVRKKSKVEHGDDASTKVWAQPAKVLGPAAVGLSSRVKSEHQAPARSHAGNIDRTNVCCV